MALCASPVLNSLLHRFAVSGTMFETSAFNAEVQQETSIIMNTFRQRGHFSPRAHLHFLNRPRKQLIRVYHRSRKDRGSAEFQQCHP